MSLVKTDVFPSFCCLANYPLNVARAGYNQFASIIQHSYPYFCFFYLKNRLSPSAEVKLLRQSVSSKKEISDLSPVIDAIASDDFYKVRTDIHHILNRISDEQLNQVIKAVFADAARKDPQLIINKLNSLLTLEKITQVVKSEFLRFDIQKAAIEIAGPAGREIDARKLENRNGLIRLTQYYILSTLDWLVETFMYIFMLRDITDGDATNTEKQMIAAMQWQAFRDNMTFISAWLIALTIYTGTVAMASFVTAAIAIPLMTIGFIYFKYFKPPPVHLHPATNLTELAAKGSLPTVLFRENIENQILTLLDINASTNNFRIYPLLIGESGVGKTDVIKSIAKKMNQGLIKESLKSLMCYSINTSMAVDGQGTPDHFELMLKNLAGYENKVFLTMDEIQGAFETPERQVLGNLLLTAMDTNGLPFMAFACTRKDYEKHLKTNPAFMRRVKVIEVDSLTESQTYAVLVQELAENFPDIIISAQVLEELACITRDPAFSGSPQPITSKRILFEAIAKLRMDEFKQEKDDLNAKLNERKILDLEWKSNNNSVSYIAEDAESDKVNSLEEENVFNKTVDPAVLNREISALKIELDKSLAKLDDFKDLLKDQNSLQTDINSFALKIEKQRVSDKELKKFIFMLNYLKPALAQAIENRKEALGSSCPEITPEVIRQKIADEKERMLKEKEGLNIENREHSIVSIENQGKND